MNTRSLFAALSLFLLLGIMGCKETTTGPEFCGTTDYQDLKWLDEWIENAQLQMKPAGSEVSLYVWEGKDVFLLNNCVGCADGATALYDCEGLLLCEFGGIAGQNTCPGFHDEATYVAEIWSNL